MTAMRMLAGLLLLLGLLPGAAAAADFELHLRDGATRLSLGGDGLHVGFQLGDHGLDGLRHRDGLRRGSQRGIGRRPGRRVGRETGDGTGRETGHRAGRHHGHRPILIVPDYARDTVARPDPPSPTEPAPPAVVEPAKIAVPLDPLGSNRRIRARASPPAATVWTIGAPLPDGVPHVTLAPGPYGLPALPPGEVYARVGHDLLRIEAATRRVVAQVERPQ